jgi:hypothetical protein
MPFYVAPSADMTEVLVLTLNKNFPAPGPVPGAVTPTGNTTPPPPPPAGGAPGTPPPGRPGG